MAKLVPAYPVPAVTSGSTSSGRGPSYETDVMGQEPPLALQKRSQDPSPQDCQYGGIESILVAGPVPIQPRPR
jgi:hypothetical protein